MSELKAVKFQHRVRTGHATLDKAFQVESKDPISGEKTKQQFRQHKPVPTELGIDDALVLAAPPTQDGSAPRVTLAYRNGNSVNGGDWHNALSFEVDVPHVGAEGAEESERFYFLPGEYEPAAESDDEEKESAADEDSSPTSTSDSSPADLGNASPAPDGATAAPEPDVTTLLDQAPAAPQAPQPAQDSPEPTE